MKASVLAGRRGARLRPLRRGLGYALERFKANFRRADVAVFHGFRRPPWGGGNQFLMALWAELEARGLRMEKNTISASTKACIFNSYNFDFDRLRKLRRNGCRMVHRVDGPLGVYRGSDDGTDRRIWGMNSELADSTIFQSQYSLLKHRELGLEFRSPFVIMNAPDPSIFRARGRTAFSRGRKTRLISTSWSDNPNKGVPTYRWIEENLDWDRFDYTFVGRSQFEFKHIKMLGPVDSASLADLLRSHDVYVTASRHDACSNALLEALACGLPAIYLRSGGNPEIVGDAGFGFADPGEVPRLLDLMVDEYEERQAKISIPALSKVADRYLSVMGIEEKRRVAKGPG